MGNYSKIRMALILKSQMQMPRRKTFFLIYTCLFDRLNVRFCIKLYFYWIYHVLKPWNDLSRFNFINFLPGKSGWTLNRVDQFNLAHLKVKRTLSNQILMNRHENLKLY